jgi:hypothetical protein
VSAPSKQPPSAAKDEPVDQIMDYFQFNLKHIVTLHSSMFDKLLFDADDVPLGLAELFEDVANTYLEISLAIIKRHLSR